MTNQWQAGSSLQDEMIEVARKMRDMGAVAWDRPWIHPHPILHPEVAAEAGFLTRAEVEATPVDPYWLRHDPAYREKVRQSIVMRVFVICEMRRMLDEEMDQQILWGDGTGDLTGIHG